MMKPAKKIRAKIREATVMDWVLISLALASLVIWSGNLYAEDGHFYANAGIGLNSNWSTDVEWNSGGQMGCQVSAGYRRSITRALWIDAGYRHYSQCNYHRSSGESQLDHVGFLVELRW